MDTNEPEGFGSPGLVAALATLAALAATLLWVHMLVSPWRLASGLVDAQRNLRRAEKSLTAGATKLARYYTLAAAAGARRAEQGLDGRSPVYALARMIPTARDALGEARHFVAAAGYSSDAAKGTLDIAQNALRGPDKLIAKDPDDPKGGSQIRLERVAAVAETLDDVRSNIKLAKRELEAVDVKKLPRRFKSDVADGIESANDADETVADAQAGFAVLPEILGADGPRNYLFGMQNSAELRGTGGAMLQFKILSIENGKPHLLDGGSVYDIDKNRQQITIPLPEDAWYLAGIDDAQRFGNANWSPDWPLSAKLTDEYAHATKPDLPKFDGIIAVDPTTMQNLMPGVGQYETKASYVTTNRVIYLLLYKAYASYPIAAVRRVVLGDIVDGFYDGMLKPKHPTELVRGMGKSLARKHMQVWLADPAEQAFVERMDWDGALQPATNADYLNVVQQNVGGNKLNYFESQTTAVDVALDGPDARVRTNVTIHNGVFLPQPRWSMGDTGPIHQPMVNVYVPGDAQLTGVSVPPTCASTQPVDRTLREVCRRDTPAPAEWSGDRPPEHSELGKKVWPVTLDIPAGMEASATFDYVVPGVVRTAGGRSTYRLVVQHQPKLRPETLELRITLPDGAEGVRAPGFKRDGGALVWDKPLTTDLSLEVSWRS
ncbi:MAG TPA: DUF4012 domain-containing protein [Actinomycetota bacterium]